MAADFIKIARDQAAATEAAELLSYVRTLRQAYELGVRVRAKMRHNFESGGSIDWSAVETLWGVPAGAGGDLFTLIDGAVGSMEGTFQNSSNKDLTERVG